MTPSIRVEVSIVVRAPLERVWAWWTDYGNAGDESKVWHGVTTSRRRVLAAGPEGCTFTDTSLGSTVRRDVRITGPHAFHESARGGARFESDWRFERAGEGRTRIVRALDVRSKPASALGPLGRWSVRRMAEVDLRAHAKEAERDLRH